MEGEGIPTTQISLIREHTEIIRPPRALWVPFELGRPLGAPENPVFQRRVLLTALDLLDAPEGPVLVDFPDEAPEDTAGADKNPAGWSCPVSFASEIRQVTDIERLRAALNREVADLRPWYDLSIEKYDRSAVVEFGPDAALELLATFASGKKLEIPDANFSLATALRLASQDLKAFYFEAVTAQPGPVLPGSSEFSQWFWQETAASRILRTVKERCLKEADESLRKTGALLLIPLDQS
ncbi:MAG: hypothetical protein HY879_13685 [Deltaproteobacteria bacterium]|nr:hypothetical protein [Deltaproteobacteria bacterium]